MFDTLSNVRVERDVSMASLTSFKTGGKAAYVFYPQSVSGLIAALEAAANASYPYAVLGNGSNVLAPDSDFEGILIVTTDLKEIQVEGEQIRVGCGASLSRVALAAMKAGLTGLEFAYGIPGTVGGALCMNAGAYGGEMKDVVETVSFLNAKTESVTLPNQDLGFGYRESYFQHNESVIYECTLRLFKGNPAEIKETMDTLMQKRSASQPLAFPSAGSTFRRPPNGYAAQLIDLSGLKGFRVGGASVSEKHAGFVINDNHATTQDILDVVSHVRTVVFQRHNVRLELEVKLLDELVKRP